MYDSLRPQNSKQCYYVHVNKSACKRLALFVTEFAKL